MSEDGKSEQPQSSSGAEVSLIPGALEQLVSNPALAEKLASVINRMSTQISSLPPAVKRRVKALKNVQLEVTKLEADFYKEVQQLEAKYQALYQPLFDKRREIVSGSYQPTDEECEWGTDEEEEEEEKDKPAESKAAKTEEGGASGSGSKSEEKGIPEFWLTAIRNTDLLADMIKEHDEPVLQHLIDIKIVYLDNTGMDFRIEFHFSDNEYFSNRILTKTYQVACAVDDDAPFSFEGAAITGSKGCKIDWNKGKNVTVKTVKKKQKHKGRGQTRTIVKTVQQESFFNTFSLPEGAGGEMDEEELQEALADDYVRAEFLRDRLVPKAVLYFTGEAVEDDEEEEYDDEGGEGSEEDEDDEDEDYDAQQDLKNAKPPECQQQ